MNKFFAGLIAFCICFSGVVGFAAQENANAEDKEEKIVTALGIMKNGTDKTFDKDTVVTRADAAVALAAVVNYAQADEIVPTEKIFSDVNVWDYAAGAIEFLHKRGIVNGYDDGNFYPDKPISAYEIYKICLDSAGYAEFVKSGAAESYLSLAVSTKLSDGVEFTSEGNVTKAALAHIIYNLFDVDAQVIDKIENNNISLKKGDIFLNEIMKLYKGKGILTADEKCSIKDGDGAGKNTVCIDGENYYDEADVSDMLGYCVDYYYKNDTANGKTICALIMNENNTSVTEIDTRDIVSLTGKTYRYYNADGAEKTAEMSAGVDAVYNWRAVSDDTHFFPEYGHIKLIDNDGDSKYDVAVVEGYDTYIVNNVSSDVIYAKNTSADGTKKSLDLKKISEYDIYNDAGDPISVSDLNSNDVLLAEESTDGSYVKIRVSEKIVTGKIASVNDGIRGREITLDADNYTESPQICLPDPVSVGNTITAYLDAENNIAYIKIGTEGSDSWHFGYLKSISADPGTGNCIARILSDNGNMNNFSCPDKTDLDGVKVTSAKLLSAFTDNSSTKRQLIRYKLSGDEISGIDSAASQSAYDFITSSSNGEDNRLLKRASGKFNYKSTPKIFKRTQAGDPDGEIAVNSSTVIFRVPTSSDDDDDFYTEEPKDISDDYSCTAEGFNLARDSFTCQAVVMYTDGNDSINYDTPLVIIDNIVEAMNRNDESSYKISGYKTGTAVSYLTESAEQITISGYTLKKGDIIRVRTDRYGEIKKLELFYSENTSGKISAANPTYGGDYNAWFRTAYGTVTHAPEDGYISFQSALATAVPETFMISSSPITVYDKNSAEVRGNAGKIYVGGTNDILEGDSVIVRTCNAVVREVIVIKN